MGCLVYLNLIMNCPLQNIRLIQSLGLHQPVKQHHHSMTEDQDNAPPALGSQMTPSFSRLKYAQMTCATEEEENTNRGETWQEGDLQKYLVDCAPSEQERNDYSYELGELKSKLIQIQEISQQEIVRLKRELQQEKQKNGSSKSTSQATVGVNTEDDHRDEEILILKESLKQQCLLNRELLKQTLNNTRNIYEAIKITKNC